MGRVLCARGGFDARHDEGGCDIGLYFVLVIGVQKERWTNDKRTSFRALITTCVPRKNFATALEWV